MANIKVGPLNRGLFITGTGTEVGKTYVTALIARQLVAEGVRVGVYKPAASGCHQEGGTLVSDDALVSNDAVALWEAAGRPLSLEAVCPQRFAAPLAPHRAAREEGRRVDAALLRSGYDVWRDAFDFVLVEGAGGLMSPLSDDDYNADLAIDLGLPLVVVAANRLGVINDTLQTVITASVIDSLRPGKELRVAGVVLNDVAPTGDASRATNAAELDERVGPPLLGCVKWAGGIDRAVNWQAL
ncbi:ATP-dependent dethiobiotin synthetase BioD 1 [Botrimarina colliarenosi]|uniref:ATP-dependent dethiobiotin synthetase BioD n=1 Tax=Botrimarina colliarenosi TaxID=2528001 RepID=A0A5C6AB72_9BACT|nr:dethiobiotin synthase [Botrimarina colliarenosi]TWT96829.1 ATP-dependent dethiobiotin synthetase BioD 1 [Botrimarina colliarenosi]